MLSGLCPHFQQQPQLKLVTNAGGMNPVSCAKAAAAVLVQAGLESLPIGAIHGDDIGGSIPALQQAGCKFENLDTGEPLDLQKYPIVSANAYLGAKPIVDALAGGARMVITAAWPTLL